MLDRADGDFHYERIAAGAAVAFENLVRALRDLDNVAVIHTGDAHPHKRRDRQPDLCRVDLRAISGDDVSVFEFPNTLLTGVAVGPSMLAVFETLGIERSILRLRSQIVWNPLSR